jgi:predicted outer membrane protein
MNRVVVGAVALLMLTACKPKNPDTAVVVDTTKTVAATPPVDTMAMTIQSAERLAGVQAADTMPPTEPMNDSTIAAALLTGDSLEVDGGKLGAAQGTDPSVKDLAQTLQTDHGKDRGDVQDLIKRVGIKPKAEKGDTAKTHHQKLVKALKATKGADFDTLFAHEAVRDHAHDIAEMRAAANQATNADLKQHIQNNVIPAMQRHLERAAHITMALQGGAGTMGAPGATGSSGTMGASGPLGGSGAKPDSGARGPSGD